MASSRTLCCRVEVDARDRADQPLRVGVARVREELAHGGFFDHLAGVHHHHALRHFGDHAHGVGDQHHRHAHLVLQLRQQVEDLGLDGHVQRGGRLVGDHQLRLAGQRDGDHHALAHAAGELVRIVVHAPLGRGDAHQLEHLHRAVQRILARQAFVQAQALGDLLADGVHRVQAGHRLLEDDRDLLGADLLHLFGAQRHQVAAFPQHLAGDDLARRHVDQLQHRLGGDALAAARFADHAHRLAAVDGDVDAVDGMQPAVVGLEVGLQALDLEQGHATRPAAGRARRAARRR